MLNLTERQSEVFAFLETSIKRDHIAPSLMEICARFGWTSPTSAADHLRLLEKKGYIRRPLGLKRAIYLTGKHDPAQSPATLAA